MKPPYALVFSILIPLLTQAGDLPPPDPNVTAETPDPRTEADTCVSCHRQPGTEASELKKNAERITRVAHHRPEPEQIQDADDGQRKNAALKRRLMSRIRNLRCPRPGREEDIDLEKIADKMKRASDADTNIQDLDDNGDLQAAIERHKEKCEKRAERDRPKELKERPDRQANNQSDMMLIALLMQLNQSKTNSMGMNSTFGMNSMMGMNSMFGMNSTMGMNPMFGMNSTMGMNPMLGMNSMMGMNPMSAMNLNSPYGMFMNTGYGTTFSNPGIPPGLTSPMWPSPYGSNTALWTNSQTWGYGTPPSSSFPSAFGFTR